MEPEDKFLQFSVDSQKKDLTDCLPPTNGPKL